MAPNAVPRDGAGEGYFLLMAVSCATSESERTWYNMGMRAQARSRTAAMTNLPKTETLGTDKAAHLEDRSSMDVMTLRLSDRDVAHEAATMELSKTRHLDTVPASCSFAR